MYLLDLFPSGPRLGSNNKPAPAAAPPAGSALFKIVFLAKSFSLISAVNCQSIQVYMEFAMFLNLATENGTSCNFCGRGSRITNDCSNL